MKTEIKTLIEKAYKAFNSRNIDEALATLHKKVEWPKAFEGGYVQGHDAIPEYWTRQWTEINPIVIPQKIEQKPNGKIEVLIKQTVKNLEDDIIFDGLIKHIYILENNLLRRMDIETE